MDTIEKVQNDCQHATLLIEKKQVQQITFLEQFQLKLHLAGCSFCRTFQTQSEMINQVAKAIYNKPGTPMRLDDHDKNQMRQKIKEKLEDE